MPETQKPVSSCARCNRRLTDPQSILRGMGPVCWGHSKGDVFERDLEAAPQEWARREDLLRNGGEIDLGCNWRFDPSTPEDPALPCHIRISLRYVGGQFEAYGRLFGPNPYVTGTEVVFCQSAYLKVAYRAAVNAGPRCDAQVHRLQKAIRRHVRRAA